MKSSCHSDPTAAVWCLDCLAPNNQTPNVDWSGVIFRREWWYIPVIPAKWEANVGLWSEAHPRQKMCDPIWKITIAKRARGMIQVVEILPSKHKTLHSNPSTTKQQKRWSHFPFSLVACYKELGIRTSYGLNMKCPPGGSCVRRLAGGTIWGEIPKISGDGA
jgi:hypothetical protein